MVRYVLFDTKYYGETNFNVWVQQYFFSISCLTMSVKVHSKMMINYNLKQRNQLCALLPYAPPPDLFVPSPPFPFLYGIDSLYKKHLKLFFWKRSERRRPPHSFFSKKRDRSCFLLPLINSVLIMMMCSISSLSNDVLIFLLRFIPCWERSKFKAVCKSFLLCLSKPIAHEELDPATGSTAPTWREIDWDCALLLYRTGGVRILIQPDDCGAFTGNCISVATTLLHIVCPAHQPTRQTSSSSIVAGPIGTADGAPVSLLHVWRSICVIFFRMALFDIQKWM